MSRVSRPEQSAVPVTVPGELSTGAGRDRSPAAPGRAIAALTLRLAGRGAVLLAVAVAVWLGVEVASYRTAYPDGVSPVQFTLFADNPAVRMMQGVPTDLGTAGGFTVWDAGWMLMLLLGIWGALTATRLLRGEEDAERVDLLLSGPIRAERAMRIVLAGIGGLCLAVGLTATSTLAVTSGDARGAVLFGIALGGVAATFASVGAIASQLVDIRRRAVGLSLAALGLAWVVRMVASSADARTWMQWLTPLGWLQQLRPYGEPVYAALAPLVIVPVLLATLAVLLRRRRDLGAGIVAMETQPRSRPGRLSSPLAFAWRSNRGVLLAWTLGLAAYSAVFGALIATMIDWLDKDDQYRSLLDSFGFGAMLSPLGFLAVFASFGVLAVALQVVWRVGAARAEEESGRAEVLLARPVSRLRWLGGHGVLALLGGVALVVVTGTATWAGAVVGGSSEITWADSMKAVLNGLPVVVLAAGLAVATFGVIPRATVALSAVLIPASYLLTVLGAALRWPSWVLDLSPFTHLALVPAQPWAAASGLVITAVGLALLVLGLVAFDRRDVVNT